MVRSPPPSAGQKCSPSSGKGRTLRALGAVHGGSFGETLAGCMVHPACQPAAAELSWPPLKSVEGCNFGSRFLPLVLVSPGVPFLSAVNSPSDEPLLVYSPCRWQSRTVFFPTVNASRHQPKPIVTP